MNLEIGKCALIALLILCVSLVSQAQKNPAYPSAQSKQSWPGRTKGYWKLRTDYLTATTIVWFYNEYNELLYKEELNKKYIKPSIQNNRRLDRLLSDLLQRKLVAASGIKAKELEVDNKHNTADLVAIIQQADTIAWAASASPISKDLHTAAFVSDNLIHIHLSIVNPKREEVLIRIVEDTFKSNLHLITSLDSPVYKESITSHLYKRTLDVSFLKVGQYKLEIKSKDSSNTFVLLVNEAQQGKKIMLRSSTLKEW
ncbi:hypothetical protein GXP67_31245 [Rhodocytophaga rosea]|uniref:Uncharacterized protein n=1 Tax=Rhodocytophaga rosea TaxID=2704465 RepID=A0A6C0GRV9_9BACT|nr:hypothetical protein [Rhodocytophaga rosea]QHT70808.1 hypothetical protein GXP67_31245 [Rhodocytophaga rosea]